MPMLKSFAACAAVAIGVSTPHAFAQTAMPTAREVPARLLPVPTTVSPQMQKIIGAPISPTWKDFPKTAEDWKAQVDAAATASARALPAMREASAGSQFVRSGDFGTSPFFFGAALRQARRLTRRAHLPCPGSNVTRVVCRSEY